MEIQELAKNYQYKSDEELLQLAAGSAHLTPEAHLALKAELARRRLAVGEQANDLSLDDGSVPARVAATHSSGSLAVGPFMAEIVRTYHGEFWLFLKLTAPAVVLGYIAVMMARSEGRDILRHVPRGVEMFRHYRELVEIQILNLAGYIASWTVGCFSFAAVCSAVRRLDTGDVPLLSDCLSEARERAGPLFRLALLLFVLMLVAMAVAMLISFGLIALVVKRHAELRTLTILIGSFVPLGLALLVFSRFGLAIPALILDKCRVGQSMFRSDELTEGKWLILAALLAKSVVGTYVAAMLPFWLASWLLSGTPVPWWTGWALDIASVAGVVLIEPILFIGFSLLYLKTSAVSPMQASFAATASAPATSPP